MLKGALILISLAVFIAASQSASSAGISELAEYEKNLKAAYGSGDVNKLHKTLKALLLAYPDHPISTLWYATFFQLADYLGPARIAEEGREIINAVRKSGTGNANQCLLILHLELEKLLYRFDAAGAKKITDILSPVRKWTLFGPYKKYGRSDMDYPFKPELMAGEKSIQLHKRIHLANYDGFLHPNRYLYPESGIAYAQFSFIAPKPVKIRVYSKSIYKIFVNGKEAAQNSPKNLRNMRIVKIWNVRRITLRLKMAGSPFDRVRVIVSDERDNILNPEAVDAAPESVEACDTAEELEFPYQILSLEEKNDPGKLYGYLGRYFLGLESLEAADHIIKSPAIKKDKFFSYLLASFFLEEDIHRPANHRRGWEIIDGILASDPVYVPAACKKMEYYIERLEYLKAHETGTRLLALTPRPAQGVIAFLKLLNRLRFDRDFRAYADDTKKDFPSSLSLFNEELRYLAERDKNGFKSASMSLLRKNFSVPAARSLIQELMSRGEYREAISLINSNNQNCDFTYELIDAYMKSGDYQTCRGLIFKQLLMKDDPVLYRALGMMDLRMREDPEMYFYKLLAVSPSNFDIGDLLRYLTHGSLTLPFGHMDKSVPSLINKEVDESPSRVLFRSRVFFIHKDRSSRLYCEDIVRVNNEEGIKRWGDIRIPYRGRFHPVRMTVYDIKGKSSAVYDVGTFGGDTTVRIKFLKKNSIVHLSYLIENPISEPFESSFFSSPVECLQHEDEPVDRISIKVSAPEKDQVRFLLPKKAPLTVSHFEGRRLYSIELENLPAIKKSAPGKTDGPLHFSFSTMNDLNDFVWWHEGLRSESGSSPPDIQLIESLLKKSLVDTVSAVYKFVDTTIQLEGNNIYSHDSLETILARKRGTSGDRVRAAQYLLERLGIVSFTAFARDKHMQEPEDFVSPDIFTHTLLYVPLDTSESLWLDFSGARRACGSPEECLSNSDAVVIVNNSFKKKKIKIQSGGLNVR